MPRSDLHSPGRGARTRRALVLTLVAALAAMVGALPARAAADPVLVYSTMPDNSATRPLDGAALRGRVVISLEPGDESLRSVTFSLDGTVVQVENNFPWMFSGNVGDEIRMFDTSALSPGSHTVTAAVTTGSGATSTVSADFTVAVPAPPASLMHSLSDDYSSPRPLDGAAVQGRVAVFLAGGGDDIASVAFALDGEPVRTERLRPYDLSADTGGRSHMLDTTTLPVGAHRVTAEVTSVAGEVHAVAASFTTTTSTTDPGPGPGPGPGEPSATRVLTVDGNGFLLDGVPFDMWGIRTASATYTQAQTDHLIAQLDTYLAHGVNTVAVYYMGSRGANYDPFSADGTSVDAGHQARMEQIIRAADERGMVVVVGIFYQAAPFGLRDADAVRAAVRTVTTELLPYRNVVLNIANEHSSHQYSDTAHIFDFGVPARIVELLGVVDSVDPERVAGGGGYHRQSNITIARSAYTDVLLFDTGFGDIRQQLPEYEAFVAAGVTKPVVNVEQLGGYTSGFPRGVFSTELRERYLREVASAAAETGLYTFFHNGPWLQVLPMRYDLGGAGTAESPGISWYFENVQRTRSGSSAPAP